MKVKKGNQVYPLITGNDIIVTKGTQSLKTVDEAFDNQQKEIDTLKSNMKYIYSYGGVGGNGSGESGSSSSTTPTLVVTLGNKLLTSDTETIALGKTGEYTLSFRVRDNSAGEESFLRIACGENLNDIDIDNANRISLTSTNVYRGTKSLTLDDNGYIVIKWTDYNDELMTDGLISCRYIVKTHTFDVKFKYKTTEGTTSEFSDENDYFIGSSDVLDPFIEIKYRIDVSDVSGVGVTCYIEDTDIADEGMFIDCGTNVTKTINIPLSEITKNEDDLLQDSNMGTYNVKVDLIYSSGSSSITDDFEFSFTLIPNSLYINVRNPQDIYYNTFTELVVDRENSLGGVPEKYITQGSYSTFYFTVYEGPIISEAKAYSVTCKVYDYLGEYESESELVYDETDFNTTPSYTSESISVDEQTESPNPFEIPFTSSGIKKIVFESSPNSEKGINLKNDTVVYIYVKEQESAIQRWSPISNMKDYYFRANCGDDTYSTNFNSGVQFSSGTLPFELKVSDSPIILSDDAWTKMDNSQDTTILSLGLQYNEVNTDDAKILTTYTSKNTTNSDLVLYSSKIFTGNSGEISIPYESQYNKSDQSKYHLVQIVRTKIGTSGYATYLYIDGIPESVRSSLSAGKLVIGKMELNNINISYNLINIQYINLGNDYTIDHLVYQYWLKYKSQIMMNDLTTAELKIYNKMNSIKFDGTNVIMTSSMVQEIAPSMPIPTLMFQYSPTESLSAETFKERLFYGYPNGDTAFGEQLIEGLYWCDTEYGWKDMSISNLPTFHNTLTSKWYIKLQGTSTMRNRIKNFSLFMKSSGGNDDNEVMLMSPNFVKDNYSTFLPENEWTLKADVADSAHANNTSIGKFVNTVCTKFNTGQNHPGYIKNTLEGFPIMMYFQIGDEVFYLGVYNFNLGRSSYYNLGYYTAEDTNEMIENIKTDTERYGPFVFSYGSANVVENLSIAEIQDNQPYFGFNQYDSSVLFQDTNSNTTKMFGIPSEKMTCGGNVVTAQNKVQSLVEAIAKAGAYCFGNIGKVAVPFIKGINVGDTVDQTTDENGYLTAYEGIKSKDDGYSVKNQVPEIQYQMSFDKEDVVHWKKTDISIDGLKNSPDVLFKCILDHTTEEDSTNVPNLNYTSAAEYYTICMAFGMVDSVVKNMNIKSWSEKTNYIAFYDMDCALGEDNAGNESISYLAAMDYWHSEIKNNQLQEATVDWDYWDNSVGVGFDCKSSYLFAIVKYAQSLLSEYEETLVHYPQQFWAELRKSDGELRSADYFVNNYFKSGVGSIPTYMAALNYQVKYLYTGCPSASDSSTSDTVIPLASVGAFHGSRVFKVRDWLNKRLHILDVMFNVMDINKAIYAAGNVYLPKAADNDLLDLRSNDDISILKSAFSEIGGNNTALVSGDFTVSVKAPKNTPIIIGDGSSSYIYILTKNIDEYNIINARPLNNQGYTCMGSREFIDMDMVNPFLTTYYRIETNNLEKVYYNPDASVLPTTSHEFTIVSSSVKEIDMQIPQLSGRLTIDSSKPNGQALNTINVKKSGLYGKWINLENLQEVNISSITGDEVVIYGSPQLTGDNCQISGESQENLTTLNKLSLTGISGNFNLINTNIEYIDMTAISGKEATFNIVGDTQLRSLTLTGFSSIHITSCPALESLYIVDEENNKCKEIVINVSSESGIFTKFNSERTGVFDFTNYTALETLEFTSSPDAEVIKMPNHKVKIVSFKNNQNLEFIDTAGMNSVIELTDKETFYMCPRYGMKQSWGLPGDVPYTTLYTRMCINESCTSLASTFDKRSTTTSKWLSTTYKNDLGQDVLNCVIDGGSANWFLNTVVGNGPQDDYYLNENNEIIDPDPPGGGTKILGTGDYRENITSLSLCFQYQSGIRYTGFDEYQDIANLSAYTSLTNISGMYKKTSVSFIDSDVLSLPFELNNNESDKIDWSDFIGKNSFPMTIDALKNISYRISSISDFTPIIKTIGADGGAEIDNSEDNPIDILDFLCPIEYIEDESDPGEEGVDYIVKDDKKYVINTGLTSISSFSINGTQYVDYMRLLDLCPNITSLSSFLNSDISRAKICDENGGMLKNCKYITYISNSFNHTAGDVDDAPTIDLYTFFNWDGNVKDITSLFSSTTENVVGFKVNKTVSYEHFKEIIGYISDYQKLTSLNNIFAYCTITDYDNTDWEIQLNKDMSEVKSVDGLFCLCKGESNGINVPLNIRRSFFKHLPNVVSLANTFMGVDFQHMLTYDFFCKYIVKEDNNVYVKIGDTYSKAKLNTFGYRNQITNMYYTFKDAKFWNNCSWFDIDLNDADLDGKKNSDLKPKTDTVTYNDTSYTTYYTLSAGKYIEHQIEEPVAVQDTRNNFTNYVSALTSYNIQNHSLSKDLSTYGNGELSDLMTENSFNIYPTYCCLPPDILHYCSETCNFQYVFANTNIMGVIPQHLLKNCPGAKLENMFLNTDILPNVIYHYDKRLENNSEYLDLIGDIDVNDTIVLTSTTSDSNTYALSTGEATVLFRDSNGKLWRRHPRVTEDGSDEDNDPDIIDYSKSQFAYVPQGFTINPKLDSAFTFRFNLPQPVNLVSSRLKSEWGITWPEKEGGNDYNPEKRPDLWPYYTQYFIMCDESVSWKDVASMKYPFIDDSYDIDFDTNKKRTLYRYSQIEEENVWYTEYLSEGLVGDAWTKLVNTDQTFNVFLNLCGQRDTRTGEFSDFGCPVSKSKYDDIKLSSFVSGFLLTFLHGRIFDDNLDAGTLTGSNKSGANIVISNWPAKNVILPNLYTLIEKGDPKVVLKYNGNTSNFYAFMFLNDTNRNNYISRYFNGKDIISKEITIGSDSQTIVKYRVTT